MYIANELKRLESLEGIDDIRESFVDNIFQIVSNYISDKDMFNIDDFCVYALDEYILETNCHKDIFSILYLEIDQPLNYKPVIKKKKTKAVGYDIPEMYLTLSEIKNGLTQEFTRHFDNNNIVWQDKFSVCLKSTVMIDEGKTQNYYFKLIPAFTYYNKDNVRGLVYYNNNDVQIEYPKLFIDNFNKKNQETNDKFRQIVLIFKNILLKDPKIKNLPSEIIETLVYNVPNNMLEKDDRQSILNVINFIRNNPLKSFKTIDEQDFAFASIYRGMSVIYCKHILKIIEHYLTNIK